MADSLDQIFVYLNHWLTGLAPAVWQPFVSSRAFHCRHHGSLRNALSPSPRSSNAKAWAASKTVTAPTASGRSAFFQPAADGIKALIKEDIVPRAADQVVHFLAPLALVVPAFLAYAVLPVGPQHGAGEL